MTTVLLTALIVPAGLGWLEGAQAAPNPQLLERARRKAKQARRDEDRKAKAAANDFVPEYDATNQRVINIPDMVDSPGEYAKYFLWLKDTNKDRKLSPAEWPIPAAKFKSLDTNKNGSIELAELLPAIEEQAKVERERREKAAAKSAKPAPANNPGND